MGSNLSYILKKPLNTHAANTDIIVSYIILLHGFDMLLHCE